MNSALTQVICGKKRAEGECLTCPIGPRTAWAQEGIYVTFNRDLGNSLSWSPPQRIPLSQEHLAWYPQVVGLDSGRRETDKLAVRYGRLFVRGQSRWEMVFLKRSEGE